MKKVLIIGIPITIIYSIGLIYSEINFSTEHIRPYVTDIIGEVFFHGINTTICTFLLWATSLLFALIIALEPESILGSNNNRFCFSQFLIFFYLGFDERFRFHEYIGDVLNINDAFVLLVIGIVELFLILTWKELKNLKCPIKIFPFIAGFFFGIMLIIDYFVPAIPCRLSLEDLTKLWGSIAMFIFAWKLIVFRIGSSFS